MAPGSYRFERFRLDPRDRRLTQDGAAVALNGRYLDALVLLVREQGKLVPKERFLEEVWRGAPVTDEALTQCIKTLRKRLGDDAARPRFIETAPKHGYRFIAPVELMGDQPAHEAVDATRSAQPVSPRFAWRQFMLHGGASAVGGAAAGVIGGLLYGFAAASQSLAPGIGGVSVLLVLVCITTAVALAGGAGVGFGIAAAGFASGRRPHWSIIGGAAGGLVVGALGKLLGVDAFNLLFGQSPGDITGAAEGMLLGAAAGFGVWVGGRGTEPHSLRRGIIAAGLSGAVAGAVITLLGGRLMVGSLNLLPRHFPDSRLRLDPIGSLFGESGFGRVSQIVTAGFEGALFAVFVVGAMILARRNLSESR